MAEGTQPPGGLNDETIVGKPPPPEPQRIGSFVVIGKLGEGGMGAVYKAHDPALDRTVALKLLPPHLAADEAFVSRFKREATAAAKFSQANLVHVYAVGEDAGTHYIAMEFVEGESLQKRIQRTGQLACDEALDIAISAAEGLRYAWTKAQLVHRDIKPDNILLSHDGDVKVADLGLAKLRESGSTNFTQTGTVMGSPHYISPEQGRGDKDVDFRSDIYSLGCTLYHMLAGKPPYEGDNLASLIHKHVYEPPPDLAAARPDCPATVASLVKRMMAKDRAKRPANYDELIAELTAARNTLGKSVTAGAAAKSRKMLLLIGAGVAVALIVGVLVWQTWKSAGGPHSVVTKSPADATERVLPKGQQKELTIELGGGVKMEFVLIPAGSFMMGSDEYDDNAKPVHEVRITKPFYLGKYEVTQEQWEEIMVRNPSTFKGAKNPVERVNWDDCQEFMGKLNDKERGLTFRLPTEAEWEYACRADSATAYCYGNSTPKLGDYAWFKDNSGGASHPVGQKQPNAWGLYDMHGNVSEWCQDVYHQTYENAPADGSAWMQGNAITNHVMRGGSWLDNATYSRSTGRCAGPSYRSSNHGVRLVVVVR